jgi:hypothetical protein
MPLPAIIAAPFAVQAMQLGAAAALGFWLARRGGPERVDLPTEDALDRLPEGADIRVDPDNGRADAEIRARRILRVVGGPGVAVDFAALARLRVRRLR